MARSTAPEYPKSRVNTAGRAVRKGTESLEDHHVIENFRASHVHVLNGFQASLRNRARDKDIIVAQRLKRRVTIYDKLVRRPGFSLTEMQDIAGCRLIFKNIAELTSFRDSYRVARFSHRVLTADNRYDYISRPKNDGYRGIHDVYEYCAREAQGASWNGPRIELQYRTIYQHAWATAVEVAGLLTDNEHKFGRAVADYAQFFRISSELISRTFEARTSCLPAASLNDLSIEFKEIDGRIQLMNLFRQYNSVAQSITAIDRNAILIFNKRASASQDRTQVLQFSSFSDAVRKLEKLENANFANADPYDVVLVRSLGKPGQGSIQSAFRNYFADTKEFIGYIDQAVALAESSG